MVTRIEVNKLIGKPVENAQLKDTEGNIIIKLTDTVYDCTDPSETRKIRNSGYWVPKVTEL
jgi:hypothetical protein